MRYDITVSKSQNLDSASRPCYEGEDYTDQEYLKLGEMIKERFQCTSPFIPRHLRLGLHICKAGNILDILTTEIHMSWKNQYDILKKYIHHFEHSKM